MASGENKKDAVFPKVVPTGDKPHLLQFGEFTLDLQRHGLYRGTTRVRLTPKPFETLAVLVEHRGTTVEKQKLLDAVWKEAFVTEDSLVKAVREIRRTLDDEKGSPRFIQTVPGEGYRFIAEVTPAKAKIEHQLDPEQQVAETSKDGSVEAIPTANANSTPNSATWTRRALVVALGTLAATALWRPWRKASSPTQRPLSTGSPTQKTISTFPGSRMASFSPDGNRITFIGDVDGMPQVLIKSLDSGEPVPITSGAIPASHPRWSPRKDEIVFSRGEDSQSIWSIPPLGGLAPTLLIKDGRNPSWSSDGNRLVFEKGDEIWTANADGTNARRIDGVPRVGVYIVDREPCFSPDGSQIAYFQPKDGPMGDIWVIPSGGGQPKPLTFDNHYGGGLAWTPDGNAIVFSSQRGGSKTLWKVHRSGGPPQPVLNSAGEDTNPAISSNGSRLIYTNTRTWWTLTVQDLTSGKVQEIRETRTDMYFPTFSPQGDRIAFFATVDDGDIHLFTIRTDTKELDQVTAGKERNVFPMWSADGSTLYFYQIRPTEAFKGIPLTGGTSFEIASGWRWRTHYAAQVDPTGKRVAYSRRIDPGHPATILREIGTGSETVFARVLDGPRWSPDGRSILGVELMPDDPDAIFGDIVVCSLENGGCRRVATRGTGAMWSGDGAHIYFDRRKSQNSREIWSVSPDGKNEKLIGERGHIDPSATFYDVSITGQVAYIQFKQGPHELWMTELE
jgi:Tol biopolymer transport system component/DNA-binding winged helix-turn-helix (wHTH) protein